MGKKEANATQQKKKKMNIEIQHYLTRKPLFLTTMLNSVTLHCSKAFRNYIKLHNSNNKVIITPIKI